MPVSFDEHALNALFRASELDPSSAEGKRLIASAQVNALLCVEAQLAKLRVEVAGLALQFGRVADAMEARDRRR